MTLRWCLWAVLVLAPGLAAADGRVEARRHFKTGMFLISDGKYDAGISELLEAYRIRPHANVLYNVARAHESAGRPVDAVAFYRRYLEANPPDADKVREALARLEPLLPRAAEPKTEPAPTPKGHAVDEASLARLEAVAEKLEAALAHATPAAPAAKPEATEVLGEPLPAPAPADDFGRPYEETVVAASRRAQSVLEAPNAITVITGEEIRLSGLQSLPEVLRRVPGAEVMTMGASSANLSFRGFNQRIANKVLVLIDGRPEYQDFLGLTLWPAFPVGLEEIERVEVIRGPGSALYGANAMLGVVNIITRAPGTGPRAEFMGGAGSGNQAQGSFVASGGEQLKYRASVGYQQADKYSVDYAATRADVAPTAAEPALGLRSARANLVTHYAFGRDVSLSVSGGVNRLFTEVYGIGLLRNYFLDGVTAYSKADVNLGPLKLRLFWNHLGAQSGPQYEPVGQRSLLTRVDSNVFDGELLFQKELSLGGTHLLGAGASGRLKRLGWTYQAAFAQELHGAAFVQDEWRPVRGLGVLASYRVDRHPLLDGGQPGYAQSPRLSVVVTPVEGHAFRASYSSAFREPTFLESYLDLRVPVSGVNGATVLTQGNRALKPEELRSFEAGYRGEAARLGLSWDVAAYWNQVSNLVVLSGVSPLPPARRGTRRRALPAGASRFINHATSYPAKGVEAGCRERHPPGRARVGGLAAVTADQAVAMCGPCRSPGGEGERRLDLAHAGASSILGRRELLLATVWVERSPRRRPRRIVNLRNPLGGYAVVNARVASRFLGDRASLAVISTRLTGGQQERPFGDAINRRVIALLTVQP